MSDDTVLDYTVCTTWIGNETFYIIQSGIDKQISPTNLFAAVPVLSKFNGKFGWGGANQVIANTGTVTLLTTVTTLTNDQASVVTMPTGTFNGQLKILILTARTATTTLAGPIGNTSIALTKKGDSAMLMYQSSFWWYVGGTATVT